MISLISGNRYDAAAAVGVGGGAGSAADAVAAADWSLALLKLTALVQVSLRHCQ